MIAATLRCALFAGALFAVGTVRAAAADAAPELPAPYAAALQAAGVPASAVALVIQPLDPGSSAPALAVAHNASVPMNPASTMKLVTTYAALNLLGPAYRWRTEAFTAGTLRGDVLDGNLAIRGSGDPRLAVEHLWLLLHRIRSFGIREIRGDVLLDRSAFDLPAMNPGAFDGEPLRPYNAPPDALLLNYKVVSFGFVPEPETGSARVVVTPPLAGLKVPRSVQLLDGPCGDWRARLQADFSDALAPAFRGGYPATCGERIWNVSILDHAQYFGAAFRALWEGAGGAWRGRPRTAPVPPQARRIALHESEPLSSVIRDINKFSNNVMARQLLLTIGAEAGGQPGTVERASATLRAWLHARGLEMPELLIDNGSGLSRSERISASSLARLLAHAFTSPLMPEFISSLPLAGVDGTMRNRTGAAGNAHIKTGLLAEVRTLAGYVHAASGRRYVVVAMINHPNAGLAQPAHDALLDWIYRNG